MTSVEDKEDAAPRTAAGRVPHNLRKMVMSDTSGVRGTLNWPTSRMRSTKKTKPGGKRHPRLRFRRRGSQVRPEPPMGPLSLLRCSQKESTRLERLLNREPREGRGDRIETMRVAEL